MRRISDLDCILLIDDDEITNYIQAREIKKAALDVHIQQTTSGRDALDYLRKTGKYTEYNLPQPGIIILDLNMPGMNGWDFLEEYRKLNVPKEKKQIIVVLTTSVNPDDQQQAAGMPEIAEYMRKPLQIDKLDKIIERHFEG